MNFVYFHGISGGPSELTLFGKPKASGPQLLVIDRCAEAIGADFPAMLDQIEDRIHSAFGSQPIALIGFSLGARRALEIAARLAHRVVRVDMISAAAPLAPHAPVGSFRQHGRTRTDSKNGRVMARFCRFTSGPPCQKPG